MKNYYMQLCFSSETQNIFSWIQKTIYWRLFQLCLFFMENQQLSMDVHV